jgi:DNA repair exonuclease SbcCD ATPase subunit
MITLKKLKWTNCFSYGAGNEIDFTKSPLTQLVGKNGHGKSSIALILEEVLYNKNSKGIKKADILNRYVKDTGYSITLTFDKDGIEYRIESKRTNAQTVKLYKNNQDISGHTATTTYKVIEDLIGIDHKTFAQIVYQSSAGSLEFLTSADTARKKFLIELLNLSKYTKAGEFFKTLAQDLTKDIAVAQAKVGTIREWIDKYAKQQAFDPKPLLPVPSLDNGIIDQASQLRASLQGITSTNKKISQNNTYKDLQKKITLLPIPDKPSDSVESYITKKAEWDKVVQDAQRFKTKLLALGASCPTCLQAIDLDKTKQLVDQQNGLIQEAEQHSQEHAGKISAIKEAVRVWEQAQKSQLEWEKYYQLIDTELPEQLLDEKTLRSQLATLEQSIEKAKQAILEAERENTTRTNFNGKLELIKAQLVEMNQDLDTWSTKLADLTVRANTIGILVKTFSTTGLVAYKIENLVKDLEEISNQYLTDLSGGRFQISFQISGSDKLNVVIVDNGRDIDIQALSGGERARVNVATLLAIRKLMQSLSQNRINLLILDETIEALDLDGKEKLVEVLLAEENLNTILVSHGFSHPLLEKVSVVKRQNISYIE